MKSQFKLLAVASALLVPAVRAESGPDLERSIAPANAAATEPGSAGNSAADLAKTLANPIGALISVPFQSNFDFGGGPAGDGYQFKLNLRPIIPISLTYDWTNDQWTVPLNLMVQQIVKIGKQPVAFSLGARYYADKPDGVPDWGLRFALIFLFPRR
ncbi:MAG: hypothetical protein NTW21_34620 [Verrucomicrobia bacterium]|nr:hypothetical protein [Verrucomicrobiota bacterium]